MTGKAALRQSGTGQSPGDGLELVYLDVARIKPYEHNPRRAPNSEFERIKASIRVDGLGQPLVVTQRPSESDYLVHAGGNTRLRILKELFAETDDPRFGTVACVVRPWTREADVLLAHLKENDLRGELTFLDKALAVADAKQLLEEDGTPELTQARLAEVLTRAGYGLSQGLISQMAYVVQRLRPLLPQTLESGIGRPQVARIRALDRAARALWLERPVDTEAEYDQVFEVLCRRYDTPDWDIANLRRALEAEIAELVAMLGPIVDTLLICTATASLILISGVWQDGSGISGVTLTATAFGSLLGPIGVVVVFVCAVCFAVTTILTYSFYGSQCAAFLFGVRFQPHYRWVYVGFIVVASVVSLNAAISIIDGAFAMMAIPTMFSALLLAPRVKAAATIYFRSLESSVVTPPR